MNLSDLISEVQIITSRPDLVNQTTSAVKAATLKCHHISFFEKDVVEQGIQFDTSEYLQTLDYRTIFPLWRNAKYFRKVDSTTLTPYDEFTVIDTDEIFTRYATERTNVAYLAGSVYNFKSLDSFQYMIVGYYKNPDITTTSYSSWIAVDHPYAIVYEAARVVFRGIGLDGQAAEMEKLAREAMQQIIISDTTSIGY